MDVNRDCKGILSLNNSKCIKGIAAVMIMLGHFTANFTNTSMQYFFAGNLWVGLFFFYSGYGESVTLN